MTSPGASGRHRAGRAWPAPARRQVEARVVLDGRGLVHGLDARARAARSGPGIIRMGRRLRRAPANGRCHEALPRAHACRCELAPLAADQEQVAQVDDQAGALAHDEHRVEAMDGVEEQRQAAADGEEPERQRASRSPCAARTRSTAPGTGTRRRPGRGTPPTARSRPCSSARAILFPPSRGEAARLPRGRCGARRRRARAARGSGAGRGGRARARTRPTPAPRRWMSTSSRSGT